MAAMMGEDPTGVTNVDLQAFEPEPPTYDNAFPALAPTGNLLPQGAWQPKFQTRQTRCTQVFTVPLEERKFKEMNERPFGEESDQMKICKEIMKTNQVSIELSMAKDLSMTIVITGKTDAVMKARREVVSKLQTQASSTLIIPREYHRFILGKNGKKLQDIELLTATKVQLPRADDKSNPNEIRITGSKEGIDKARHEIEAIHEEQAKLAFERLPIPKVFHPFVCGPHKENINRLTEETGAKISVPPHKDEIVVSGEKEGVLKCKQQMMAIYEEKKRKCQAVSVEVKKSQHKYVVGPRYSNIQEILANTGVSVEVPDPNSPSETITLRGEQDKLGQALTEVYNKANSVIFADVTAPAWLHRFIIGKGGSRIKEITENFPSVHIEFTDGQDKITVEGPPEEVGKAVEKLQEIVNDLKSRMDFAEIQVDQKFHKHIIGRSGANISRLKQDTGVNIKIPSDGENSNIIRIEGDPKGVQIAKEQLLEMANRMENEKTRDVLIEHRFHRQLIGAKGENIREIRDKFNQVQITFPDPGKKSDVVQLRGPKNDVDRAFKFLQAEAKKLVEKNYQAEVHIFKDLHKNVIGKGGSTIKKIREETDTKIDLPSENSESDVITITGRKANVEKAQAMIEAIQKEMGNIKEVTVDIPQQLHNSLIGTKGRFIRSIMEENGGVMIRFPQEGSKSDKVVIRGPAVDVENAKQQLKELANERKESSFTADVKAKPQYHKFLIGRGGSRIKKVRESTGVRIIFPGNGDQDQETISIIGKEDGVKAAKAELEALIKDLDNIVEQEIQVDPKHHRYFVARRGEVLRQISDDYGGVIVSFPRSGLNSDRVVIKGSQECVEAAKKKILELVQDLEDQVTIECVIPQSDHRTVMGSGGTNVREITRQYEVGIKFPDKPVQNGSSPSESPSVNGESSSEDASNGAPRKNDIITITGKPENCQNAKQALLDLVPVLEEVTVPFEFHKFIIGLKGRDVRRLMQEYDVNISIPPAEEHSNMIKVRGPPTNVARARDALFERVVQLEAEKEKRELKSFKLTVEVDEKYHPKIIGRKGASITAIRKKHDVNIQFPDKGSENPNLITITGFEQNANDARDEILNIVKEYEEMYVEEVPLDSRVHPRIIGTKGRGINKLMADFGVELRFPKSTDPDPNVVIISGEEEKVLDCKEHLLNLEEEFLQDVVDQEYMQEYQRPPSRDTGASGKKEPSHGFVVKDAPWDRAPDTASQEEFPSFGAVVAPKGSIWGSNRK